jgi:nicotinamidase/pyrazinamidase
VTDHRALIVVDMQRGFLEEGYPLYCGQAARTVIPVVQARIEAALDQAVAVFFTADAHAPDDREFALFPPHCIRGTEGAQIIPELSEYLSKGTRIDTTTYSGFFDTDLHIRLQSLGVTTLELVGVCTDICVLHTAIDAYHRGYALDVIADGVASFDEAAHAFALKHMKSILGARISEVAR